MASQARTAREIFNEAVENVPPDQWPEFLDRECKDDAAMRDRVQRLLDAHGDMGDFMQKPAAEPSPTMDMNLAEKPGTEIGPYTIREKIGEGGFGVVYVAEQIRPVRRRVALKVIKPGMDTKEVVARFEAERQALALMNHPNVARVLDAGATDSSRPYFVMELVNGLPITEFCDKNKLSTRDRLDLYLSVCHAVHHAHQKGIIHRDLKPSNVMVTLHDGKPVPKVIDFGVAKALSQQLTEKTIYTSHGQAVGTPQYMSPEQAEMSGLGIDTRSDIYSLGVLLYELLTGTPPVDKKRLLASGYAEMMRIIREEEPPRPSKRLSTLGQPATAIAQQRRTDQKTLSRSLRGEVDWIVMKSLEKDRERRYDTVATFAADIERFLKNETVQACPPSAAYRFRKFVSRNPALIAVTLATTVALMLTVAMIVSVRYQRQLTRAKDAVDAKNTDLQVAKDSLDIANGDLRRVGYFRSVSQALSAWYQGATRRARRLLDQCPPELRHWEWYYVDSLFDTGVMTLQGHTDWVSSVVIGPDGRTIVSGGADSVRVWDGDSGQETLMLPRAKGQVTLSADGERIICAERPEKITVWDTHNGEELLTRQMGSAFAIDSRGEKFITSSDDHALLLWDAENRRQAGTFKGHTATIRAVAFSPDGKWVASGGDDNTIRVWNADSGEQIHTLMGHTGAVNRLHFSPDGKKLLSTERYTSPDKRARLWDTQTGEEICFIDAVASQYGRVGIAFSPDGSSVAVPGKVCDTETGLLLFELEGHSTGADFSKDGKRIVTGGHDHMVRVWDAESGRELSTFKGHTGVVQQVIFSDDGRRVVSASRDGTVKVWDTQASQEARTLSGHSDRVFSVAYSPDGRWIASGSRDKTIRVWDAVTGRTARILEGHTEMVRCVTFSSDGRWIASGSHDKTIRIWDTVTGQESRTLTGHTARIWCVAFSPDGKWIASGSSDNTVKVWDAETGQVAVTFRGHNLSLYSVAFSPDGKQIVSGNNRGGHGGLAVGKVWDAVSGQERLTLVGHLHNIYGARFSLDGKRIFTGSWDNTIKVWDAESGEEKMTLWADGFVYNMALSPDGKRIAAGCNDGTIKVWDTHLGHEVLTLHGHTEGVRGVAFSSDGQRLVSGSDDGTVRIWDAGTAAFIDAGD